MIHRHLVVSTLMGIAAAVLLAGGAAAAPAELAPHIQAVQAADGPEAATAAYVKGLALDSRNIELREAYLRAMVDFGLAGAVGYQATMLVNLDPDNGLGWAVLAYDEAGRGAMTGAFADILRAAKQRPDDPFVLTVAGQLVAWHDAQEDASLLPGSLRAAAKKLQADLGATADFQAGYRAVTEQLAAGKPVKVLATNDSRFYVTYGYGYSYGSRLDCAGVVLYDVACQPVPRYLGRPLLARPHFVGRHGPLAAEKVQAFLADHRKPVEALAAPQSKASSTIPGGGSIITGGMNISTPTGGPPPTGNIGTGNIGGGVGTGTGNTGTTGVGTTGTTTGTTGTTGTVRVTRTVGVAQTYGGNVQGNPTGVPQAYRKGTPQRSGNQGTPQPYGGHIARPTASGGGAATP